MLEITKLNDITIDDFKNTIDIAVSNKYFIRTGFHTGFHTNSNTTIMEQLGAINNLIFNPNKSHIMFKTIGNIEWTPVKLYDTAYYMVNVYNKYWFITHNSYDKFVIKYSITIKEFINYIFNYIKKINYNNIESIPIQYYLSNEELFYSVNYMEQNKLQYILIKQMLFQDHNHKINHYLIKIDSKIYYFPISSHTVYKPIPYTMSLSN